MSVLKQKLSKTKGYTDVTELSAEPVVGTTPVDNKVDNIKDLSVRKLVHELMGFANNRFNKIISLVKLYLNNKLIQRKKLLQDY
jgi:hypothetical protein